jgi:hypothetical protein
MITLLYSYFPLGFRWEHVIALLLCISWGAPAYAAEVYKCIGKDKAIYYQGTPCDGAKPSTAAQAVRPRGVPDTARFSQRQADEAYECIDALDFMIHTDGGEDPIAWSDMPRVRGEFNARCGVFGFGMPDAPGNRAANKVHAQNLRKNLKDNNHTGQMFVRTYVGGQRSPPLFTGY